ncbi:MAG TPA: AsmA family protein [Malonomonas sp.]
MSGLKKILLVLLGLLVTLMIVVVVLIKVLVTPEKIRETVVPLAEKQLQRKVEVGDINIGIFSGVSLADLKVMQRDNSAEFVSARAMSLSYQFWPLLTGKIVLDEIRLEQPKILVVRNPDGSFNFSDLQQRSDQPTKTQTQADDSPQQSSGAAGLINLLVNEVTIDNGELLFIDRLQNAEAPFRYSLEQLNLQARQITLDKAFPIAISAQLNGSRIELAGTYDIAQMAGDIDLQLTPLDLAKFAPYYRDALPGTLGAAHLSLNLEASLQADRISSKGKIALNKVDLVLKALPDAALKQADLTVDYAINYQLENKVLDISTLLVNFNGIALAAEGDVKLAGAEPQLALALLLNKFDLRKLNQGLPAGLVADLDKFALAGLVDGRIELAGQPSAGAKLLKGAQFQFDQVKATVAGGQAAISGAVSYAGQVAQAEKLNLSFNEQQAQLSFKVNEPLGKIIRGEFQIEADSLDLNRLMPATAAGSAPAGKTEGAKLPPVEREKTIAEDIGPFDLPLVMKGTLAVNRLLYKQLTMERVKADLLLKDNRLTLSSLRSELGGGELLASADIDLGVKGLAYSGQLNVGQSNLTSLVSGLFPQAKQSVSGLLEWQNSFSGRGTIPDVLLKQLQLDGTLRVGKGKVTGSPLLEQFSNLLGSPDLKVLSFNDFSGNYSLQKGLASLKADLDSSKTKLRPEGTIGLDGAMNMKLDARLAPALLESLGAAKELKQFATDADGWGMLPLQIKGTVNQPQIGYDTKALQKQATERVTQEASKQLMKKLGDKGGDQAPVKELLDGTLKKLFGN